MTPHDLRPIIILAVAVSLIGLTAGIVMTAMIGPMALWSYCASIGIVVVRFCG